MRLNSKILLIFLLLFIIAISTPAFAISDYEVSIEPVNKDIYPDEYAKFIIKINNTLDSTETFTVSSATNWIYSLEDKFTNLAPNESLTTVFSIKPKGVIPAGKSYNLPLKVTALITGITKNFYIPVYLMSYDTGYKGYIPSLNLYAEYDENVDPNNGFKLKLRLRNRNALDIKNMNIVVDGGLFYKEFEETLLPQQEKSIQVNFDLDPYQEPGAQKLEVKLNIDNKTYASLVESYIIEQVSDVQVSQQKSREFLRTLYTLNIVNNGNIHSTKSIEMQKNWIERIFLRSDNKYEVAKSEGKPVVKWVVELDPEEELTITVSNNYRVLFAIALIILIIIYLYYNLRSEIIIKKKASVLHMKRMEGVSRIKIKLFIKNRTSKKLHDVEVREKVSKLTELVEEKHSLGSLRPSKVVKGKSATLVKWNFEHLEPYEERIITYKLESKLKLVGSVQFPRTIIKFKNHDGKICRTGSNKPTLSLVRKK